MTERAPSFPETTMRYAPLAITVFIGTVSSSCSTHTGIRGTSKADALLPCPQQTLSVEEVEALAKAGEEAIDVDQMGEHRSIASLERGMPMLKTAALHGHVGAMSNYASLVNWYGFIDTDGEPFLGRTVWENAEEGMLYSLLAAHLGDEIPFDEQETFRILLDPSIQLPRTLFRTYGGFGWMLQHWKPHQLNPIRAQAYAWKDCWKSATL